MRAGGVAPALVGHRMGGLDDLDRSAGHGVAVAGDDEAGERARPVVLDRLGHRRRGLAGAEHDGAALGRRRQVRRHDASPGSAAAIAASNRRAAGIARSVARVSSAPPAGMPRLQADLLQPGRIGAGARNGDRGCLGGEGEHVGQAARGRASATAVLGQQAEGRRAARGCRP